MSSFILQGVVKPTDLFSTTTPIVNQYAAHKVVAVWRESLMWVVADTPELATADTAVVAEALRIVSGEISVETGQNATPLMRTFGSNAAPAAVTTPPSAEAVALAATLSAQYPALNRTVQREQSATCEPNGEFTLSFARVPQAVTGMVTFRFVAPHGQTLKTVTLALSDLPVAPDSLVLTDFDPHLYYPLAPKVEEVFPKKLRGKAIDLTDDSKVADKQIIFWAKRTANSILSPVLITRTDASGSFADDFPSGYFTEAFASISDTDHEQFDANTPLTAGIPIDLVRSKVETTQFLFPEFLYLVVGEVIPIEDEDEDDCGCHAPKVPRNPDFKDMEYNAEAYSQDIGGACMNLTTPNRSLEEFSYYTVVRTTDPVVRGFGLDELAAAIVPNKTVQALSREVAKPIEEADENVKKEDAPILHKPLSNGGLPVLWLGRADMDADNMADWDDTPHVYQAVTVAHGHILHFKQVWKADGYSLGDLKSSIGLAPSQQKNIAKLIWERHQVARREEELRAQDTLSANIDHSRDINEITSAALTESSRGGSSANTNSNASTLGFAAGGFGPGFFSGVAGGFSTADSNSSAASWQNSSRNASANAMQGLRDRVQQGATTIRSQRASTVVEIGEEESVTAVTEVIANYNHCHALTIMYFEVLRHFRVEQGLANVQECLFIPLKMSLFDEKKVLRWKNSLRPAIAARKTFDPETAELLRGFDAIERIHTGYANLDMPKARYADDNFKAISGEITLKMWLNRPADTKIDAVVNPTTNVVTVPERWELNLPSWIKYNRCGNFSPSHIQTKFERVATIDREAIFEKGLGNSIAQGILKKIEIIAVKGSATQKVEFDIVIASTYKRGQPMRVLLRQANNTELLSRADFDYIDIQLPSDYHPGDVENSLVMVDSLRINYQTTHYNGTILSTSGIEDDLGYNDKVRIYTPTNENEKRNPKNEDARLRSKLLNHFNTNIELYHQVLWWNMSAEMCAILA